MYKQYDKSVFTKYATSFGRNTVSKRGILSPLIMTECVAEVEGIMEWPNPVTSRAFVELVIFSSSCSDSSRYKQGGSFTSFLAEFHKHIFNSYL